MSVLFVSDVAQDAHLLPVARELWRRGVGVAVFNPGAFPTTATITVESTESGQRTTLAWDDQTLDLATVRSAWYRRPGRFEFAPGLLPEEAAWIRAECNQLVDGIWSNTNALWVSDPHAIRRANQKILQTRLARELGFRVPSFTVTNDPKQVRAFIDAHPEGVVVKALANPTLLIPDKGAGMVYTHRVTAEDLEALDSVRHGPTFLQAFVRKERDLRVTVIGDQVFSASLESGNFPGAEHDFREAEAMDIPHHPFPLPPTLEDACRELVSRLGLRFGAIDLLHSPEGEYFFLEINPNGQWYWIEMTTELPLARAMADLLERGLHGEATTPPPAPPRAPRTVQIGEQTIPLAKPLALERPPCDNGTLHLAGTRTWLERKKKKIFVHVGDLETGALLPD